MTGLPNFLTDPKAFDTLANDDGPGTVISPQRLFSAVWNTQSHIFSARWDEARKDSLENSEAMLRDAYFRALLQERIAPLTRWDWEIVSDPDDEPDPTGREWLLDTLNPKDPYSTDREAVAKGLTACVRRTKDFHQMRYYLGMSIWYGRYAAQVRWDDAEIAGQRRKIIGFHDPILGDKIHYTFDGKPAVLLSPMARKEKGWDVRTFDTYGPALVLDRPELRQKFIIHKHMVEDADYLNGQQAGRRHGVGLRDFAYWAWWMRDEMLSWLMRFMEKVGSLGLLVFYYDAGNKDSKAAAVAAANKVGGGNSLAIACKSNDPRVGSVELIPANMTGVGFLKDVINDIFEGHIERLFVGQTLSAGTEGSGLGGTGVADFHADTKFNLLCFDADNLAETLTNDLVCPLKEFNYRGCKGRFIFRFKLPDPNAEKKLEAAVKLTGMGVTIKTDEVREAGGYSKPDDGDETVGGMQEGMAGMPGQAAGTPGGIAAAGGTAAAGGAPTPGMAELVTAMVTAGASGDVQAVKALAALGKNTEQLQAVMGGTSAEPAEEPKTYRWSQATSKSGQIKAVWSGAPARPPLYGKEAEAALRGKQPGQDDQDVPKGPAAKEQPADAKPAKLEPHEVYHKAITAPSTVTPDELDPLAEHLLSMEVDELRAVVAYMTKQVKAELVTKILNHVGASSGAVAVNPGVGTVAPTSQPATTGEGAARFLNIPDSPVPSSSGEDKPPEKTGVSLPDSPPEPAPKPVEEPKRATVTSAEPAKGTNAPSLGSGPGKHPLQSWVDLHKGRAEAAARAEKKAVKLKAWKGASEAAKARWAKNTAETEKHIAGLHKKIEALDKKESVAKYVKSKFPKIRFDSEMERVYGSIKDAHENGFPRGMLSKTEGESIDNIAESSSLASLMKGKPESAHPTDYLIELIATGARQDVESSGEREKLAEELYHLERNRDHGLADNKLAEIIRSGRKSRRREKAAGGSGTGSGGLGQTASEPDESELDRSYADDELPEVEEELDDFFGDASDSEAKSDKTIPFFLNVPFNTYRPPMAGQSASTWWNELTEPERRVVLGSSNHRRWASNVRGNAAIKTYGSDAALDQFISKAWEYHIYRRK